MLAVLLATASAMAYGASDFSGAMATRDNDATLVTIAVQAVSLASLAVVLLIWPPTSVAADDLAWGAVGGLGASLGLVTFYRALATGPMSVAAALTALWSTTVPVLAGLALGDRPATVTLVGIGIAVPSAVLVSIDRSTAADAAGLDPRQRARVSADHGRTRLLATIAGLGFALFFIALSRTSPEAGLAPLVGARIASIAALAVVLSTTRRWAAPERRWWLVIALAGVLDCAANSLYLSAVHHGSLAWVAAITSLYPVSTVLLARVVAGERLASNQVAGLAAAAAALALIGVGA